MNSKIHPANRELPERFEALEMLGEGRLSRVWKVRDGQSPNLRALKVLHPQLLEEETIVRRFRREVGAARRLDHRRIVRIDEVVEEEGFLAMVMEYVPGRSLKNLIQSRGPMDPEQAEKLLRELLSALAHAHDRGVIHRDLTPYNVVVDDEGNPKIIGFGMARIDELAGLTTHTAILGSLEYMAPEQIAGAQHDSRVDLYALGVMLVDMLRGRVPTRGTTPDLSADLPHLAYIAQRAMAVEPGLRFATAHEMLAALDTPQGGDAWRKRLSISPRRCSACNEAVIEGLVHCLHCGHAYARMVHEPGEGKHSLIIERKPFKRDVWFEVNLDKPTILKMETLELLFDALREHEDTRPLFTAGWQYYNPPYVLFDGLKVEEAEGLKKKLEEKGLYVRVHEGHVYEPSKKFKALASLYIAVGAAAVVVLGGVPPLAAVIAAISFYFVSAMMFEYWRREEAKKNPMRYGAYPVMLPSQGLLDGAFRLPTRDFLAPDIQARARRISAPGARADLYSLLGMFIALFRDGRIPSAEIEGRLKSLLDEALETAVTIDALEKTLMSRSTAATYDALEKARARRDVAGSPREAATPRRAMEDAQAKLDELDEASVKIAFHRSRLLQIRGTLSMLLGRFDEDEIPTIVDVEEQVSMVRERLEAHREVEALLEGV